jgi:hypothetical protein
MSFFARSPLYATARTLARTKTFKYGARGFVIAAAQKHALPDLPYAYNVSQNQNQITRLRSEQQS